MENMGIEGYGGYDATELAPIVRVLRGYGDTYSGGPGGEVKVAVEWLEEDMDAGQVDEWLAVGVWDAVTAAAFWRAGLSPLEVRDAAESIDIAGENGDGPRYSPDVTYAACHINLAARGAIIAEALKAR